MLGEHLLVAPILNKNQDSREVYLPEGSWWQETGRELQVYEGGQWLADYKVGLYEIASFNRVPPPSI